jgi:two-component system cell cycle sensor histidine kinase/response regulator CckA
LTSTAEGIFGLDREGRCTFANRASVALLGYQDERALRGKDIHVLIHHSRPDGTPYPREECQIYQAWRQGQIAEVDDDVFWRADGSHFFAEYRAYPMIREGQVVGTVVSFTDITERKEKEAHLLQAQKMQAVGQLTGGIAHDFNNLLTIILGNLDFLSTGLDQEATPEIQELVKDALSAARDAAELTQRLLAVSRRQPLQPKHIGLGEVVRRLKPFLRRILGERFELQVNSPDEILTVFADPSRLQTALLNLIINARDAMPRGGTLTIDIFRTTFATTHVASSDLLPGSYAIMRVTDFGTGMTPDVLCRAIEPFFTTKPSGKGTGLGLSMAYNFAKQSGGALRLKSEPGIGTSVSLLLPEAEPVKENGSTGVELEILQSSSATILVVEDEPRVRKLLTRRLRNLGYRVIESENAQSAKQLIESRTKLDLLFSDIVMPGEMNGYDLVRWAREKRPELRLLLTTGADSERAVSQISKQVEGVFLLRKPYSEKMLRKTIRSVLNTMC